MNPTQYRKGGGDTTDFRAETPDEREARLLELAREQRLQVRFGTDGSVFVTSHSRRPLMHRLEVDGALNRTIYCPCEARPSPDYGVASCKHMAAGNESLAKKRVRDNRNTNYALKLQRSIEQAKAAQSPFARKAA